MRLNAVKGFALGAALASASAQAAGALCEITGEPGPDVPTLMASTREPTVVAWIVKPDCSYEIVREGENPDAARVDVRNRHVERVASIPSKTTIFLSNGGLSRGGDFTASAKLFFMSFESVSSVKDFVFPDTVGSIIFKNGSIDHLADLTFPTNLEMLSIQGTTLKSLRNVSLPASIESLTLLNNQLTEIDFKLPANLTALGLSRNPITKIERVKLPETLTQLYCADCNITSFRGVNLPASLSSLTLGSSPITTLEIRKSDLPTLQKVRSYNFNTPLTQSQCSDATAELVSLDQGNVCVISDDQFAKVYGIGLPPSPTATPPATLTPQAGSESMPSVPETTVPWPPLTPSPPSPPGEPPSAASTPDTPPATPTTSGTDDTIAIGLPSDRAPRPTTTGTSRQETGTTDITPRPLPAGSSSVNQTTSPVEVATHPPTTLRKNGTSRASVLPGTRDADEDPSSPDTSKTAETTSIEASSSSSQLLTIILTVIGTTFVLLLLAVGYRKARTSMAKQGSEATSPTANYSSLDTPMASGIKGGEPSEPQPSSQEYLANDIRNDKLLAHFRVEGGAIEIGAPIARGGFGIIYTGVVHGERVAIKQMLPDTWRDEATVTSFMDEIRMCVSLNHPKIVRCIGISWTSLRDLSVVTEYMERGDLHSVLQTHRGEPTGREWSEPWTDANLMSKSSIASDVAEAVVYLHSFNTPIIHRDLKAQNVLLDSAGNAKLSDFGISREVAMDETMTREIGTMAWIAPEVLRGERYSEKADIYSLGVLLVEMDRCRHPYAHEGVMSATEPNASGARGLENETSQAIVKNTKIAILVSTGMLRPTPSPSCPDRVKHVMTRCLAFDAAERPTAQEVVTALGSMQPL